MAWIESHETLRAHPKLKKLARILKIHPAQAIGHLHCLWWWSMNYAPNGDLTNFDFEDIADGAAWDGSPQELIDALVSCGVNGAGFLERVDGQLLIHDWDRYIGKLLESRQSDRDRKRQSRSKTGQDAEAPHNGQGMPAGCPPDVPSASDGCPSDVRRTSGGQDAEAPRDGGRTVPNRTVPNRTVPNQLPPPPTPSSPEGGAAAVETSPEPPNDGAVKVADVVELWNAELCPLGFPKVSKITPDRRKHFRARLRDGAERRELAWWRDRIAAIAGSDFMRKSAAEKAPWLTFDWLLNETNLVKVAEDKYGHGLNLSRGQPLKQGSQPMDEYLRELKKDPFWGDSGGDETCPSATKLSSQPA